MAAALHSSTTSVPQQRAATARPSPRGRTLVTSARSALPSASQAPSSVAPATQQMSNIVPAELSEGQRRKMELQAQAQAALAADNAWWEDTADAPPNLVAAATPAEYKQLIVGAGPTQLVVVDYLKPSCGACRRLFPKLKQIAASNPETLFIKVNVDTEEMRELAQGMQVAHLPWFHLFLNSEMRASFSANLTTVSSLRAEIATNKPCTDPGCSAF